MYQNEYGERFITGADIRDIIGQSHQKFGLSLIVGIILVGIWLFSEPPNVIMGSIFYILLLSFLTLETLSLILVRIIDSNVEIHDDMEFLFTTASVFQYQPVRSSIFVLFFALSFTVLFLTELSDSYVVIFSLFYVLYVSYSKFRFVGHIYDLVMVD